MLAAAVQWPCWMPIAATLMTGTTLCGFVRPTCLQTVSNAKIPQQGRCGVVVVVVYFDLLCRGWVSSKVCVLPLPLCAPPLHMCMCCSPTEYHSLGPLAPKPYTHKLIGMLGAIMTAAAIIFTGYMSVGVAGEAAATKGQQLL